MTAEEYFLLPDISNSDLQYFRGPNHSYCPLSAWQLFLRRGEREYGDPLLLGHIVHKEPETRFGALKADIDYVPSKFATTKGKGYKKEVADLAPEGKYPVPQTLLDQAHAMIEAIKRDAPKIYIEGITDTLWDILMDPMTLMEEIVVEDGMRAMMDCLAPQHGIVIDHKTISFRTPPSPQAWEKKAIEFGYHMQAFHYLTMANKVGDYDRFMFHVIQKEFPHNVMIFEMSEYFLELGEAEYIRCKERMAEAQDKGLNNSSWRFKSQLVNPPAWAESLFEV